ncbi:MAG: DUF4918 domain-containing protein [Ignavibacteria bacterium RIFOXYB2_FULL_35_12]|nr:MAG: DUF4918 domain-containing protein [Ignavibacteria bacterium GWF2_35_20]OGU79636.1 MAG: DUF4918 domain-containing protein [Ignavibacteria bacterium RIFOXYA2_FULL_35_9]OGU88255.1 MAG: DUF4918 domain-containing protein [Ignavibacteria bacterium RIFOXYA12_FULL_35_25]OGU91257.1 MAG: DUF4918 domain-containing protein [Ignavibacteria bacterium RIFOXYC12_FULL_35_11]OGU93199.1 MAG: DUF4918 domain-containing protein [Ignavibacteria bacterium RIFOXYB12_FULL_35_14]OGU99176.1 MAG: DUF4918 domain-co
MPTFADTAIKYFTKLKAPAQLPSGVQILNPYENESVKSAVKEFYQIFYDDERKRIFVLGINPGRFGGGLTGVSFTDPVALRKHCGIDNQLGNKAELSSKFVYEVINHFGGVKKFFSYFFLSAIYPLALIKDGKNYNYYDDKKLFSSIKPHLKTSLKKQIEFGADRRIVICLGKKNAEYLKILNDELMLFDKIETLDHPRFIMQYRKKKIDSYISQYITAFDRSINHE